MNSRLLLTALAIILGVLSLQSAQEFPDGTTWTETQYFVEKFTATTALPAPGADWKLYSRSVVEAGAGVLRIEQKLGNEPAIPAWIAGKTVVQQDPDGRLTTSPRSLYDLPAKPEAAWTKNLQPAAEVRHRGTSILVYDAPAESGGGRVWIDEASGEILARWLKKFVTLYTTSPNPAPFKLPADVQAALDAAQSQRKKSPASAADSE